MPDDISISMTKRKSPSGNRVIKISLEQYVAVPGSMQKKPSGSGNARKRKPYATKKAAGETDEVPGYLPVITNGKYRDAMGFNRSSSAYLQVLSGDAGLSFKNGSSSMNGFPATYEKIKGHCVDEGIGKIHLPLLMMLYGILLQKFSSSPEKHGMDGTAAFFFPDLAKKTGKPHTGVKDIEAVTSSMEKLKNIVGIVDSGQKSSDIIPLLSGFKYDENRNTIQFSSPYMARIIREIQKESIRKDKYGSPVLNGDGEKQMLPAYSYLVDISIEKERNRKAAEIVMIIVALIERTGKHTPHIRAKTIVAHSSLLKGSLQIYLSSKRTSSCGALSRRHGNCSEQKQNSAARIKTLNCLTRKARHISPHARPLIWYSHFHIKGNARIHSAVPVKRQAAAEGLAVPANAPYAWTLIHSGLYAVLAEGSRHGLTP